MPLLNGQAFAAAKKPAKVKIKSAKQVTDTMNVKVTWKKAKNAKKYNVKVDKKVVKKNLKKKTFTVKNLTEGKHKIYVQAVNGKKKGKWSKAKTVTVTAKADPTPPTPAAQTEISGVTQSGKAQLKVTFSQPVDPTGMSFAVTVDGKTVTVTAKADPADPNSVLLDLPSTIKEGAAIAVAVTAADGTAIPTAAGASTDVKGETEKVNSIEVDPNLVLTKKATQGESTGEISYKILNQFGEDVTKKYDSDVVISSSIGTAVNDGKASGRTAGVQKVERIPDILSILGSKGTVVAVHTKAGINVSQEVTVGDLAKVNTVTIKGIYSTKTEKEMSIIANDKDKNANAAIVFELKDQYDRVIKDAVEDTGSGDDVVKGIRSKLSVNVVGGITDLKAATNTDGGTTSIQMEKSTIADEDVYVIPFDRDSLEAVKAGDASVIIVSNETGAKDQYNFTVGNEKVVASLTITAPNQVVGGQENEFAIDAKNAAGEAVTSYDLLKKNIKLPNEANATRPWFFVKNSDGTAKLVYEAAYVKDKTAQNAFFTVNNAPQAYANVTFDIVPGSGMPVEITGFKSTSTNGQGYAALSDITYVDAVDGALTKIGDFCPANQFATQTTPDANWITENEYKITVELTSNTNKLELAQYDGTEETVAWSGLTGKGTKIADIAISSPADFVNVLNNIYVRDKTQNSLQASAKGNVAVTLSKKDTADQTYTQAVTVVKKAADDPYDDYVIYLKPVDDSASKGVTSIYTGTLNATTGAWDNAPAVTTFAVTAKGLITGDKAEYELEDAAIGDSLGLIENETTYLSFSRKDVKNGLKDKTDTISLYLGKEDNAVKELTVKFSDEEPAAASIDKDRTSKDYVYDFNMADGDITATEINEKLVVRDQYGVIYNMEYDEYVNAPIVTFKSVEFAATNTDAKYEVTNNGRVGFKLTNNKGEGTTPLANGDIVKVTVKYDDKTQDIALKLTGIGSGSSEEEPVPQPVEPTTFTAVTPVDVFETIAIADEETYSAKVAEGVLLYVNGTHTGVLNETTTFAEMMVDIDASTDNWYGYDLDETYYTAKSPKTEGWYVASGDDKVLSDDEAFNKDTTYYVGSN